MAPARSEDVAETTATVELATDSTPTEEPTGEPTPTDTAPTEATPTDTAAAEPEPTTGDAATAEPEPTTADTTSPEPEPAPADTTQAPAPAKTEDPATTEPAPTASPTIASDLADYPPGAAVTLTGAGWLPDTSVRIVVNDTYGSTWKRDVTVPVSTDGSLTDSFNLPAWFVSDYDVTAIGSPSGRVATARFTDLPTGTYDQCSNDTGTGYTSGDTGCRWINGNLQANSAYFEGDATVQRLWLKDFAPGSTHTVTLKYGTTKGGKHAYDFLTTWEWSEDWIALADRCQDIGGCTTANETTLDIPQDPNVPDSFESSAPGDRQFVMRGATLTSATTPSIASGTYAGDSETVITVSFTVDSSGSMCTTTNQGETTCGVALWFGAHVAAQANWGLGLGAGSISGSPYHVALDLVDGASVGQRDNQMAANIVTAIPNGTIVIVKDAVPNDAQDFSFNLNNDSTISQDFLLDDDADPVLPNSQTFSVPPGTWTASELNIPTGWSLTNLVCVDPTNNTSVNLGTATATIGLASNETVTCTFTDSKQAYGDLTVTKTAVPSFSRDYDWTITKEVDKTRLEVAEGDSATFNYTVTVTPSDPTDSDFAVSGVITLSNPNPVAVSGVTVNDAVDNGGTCDLDVGPYTLAANSTRDVPYTCTYASPPTSLAGTNTATATWTAGAPFGTSGSASGSTAFDFESATPTVTDGTVTVQDDKTDPANPVTLGTWDAVDGAHSFTYALEKSGAAGTCTEYKNTATISETGQSDDASVELCVGSDLVVSKDASGTFDRTYLWKITKDADKTQVNIADGGAAMFSYTVGVSQTGFTDSGWQVSGSITVANPNDWQDITADVSDVIDNGGTCVVEGGTSVLVPQSMQVTLHYDCTYASAPSSYTATNTATADWDNTQFVTPNGSASGQAGLTLTQDGTTNQTIHVTDSYAGDLGTVTATDAAPFATDSFTYTRTVSGRAGTCTTYDNTATITETGQSASKTVTVCVGADLTLTKTASTSLSRLYRWTIDKTVDHTRIDVAGDGTATFGYTVTVTPAGFTDSSFAVQGAITVSNPNDWQAVTVDVTDALPGGTCTVTGGTQVEVLASGSTTVNYSCTVDSGDTVSNTATATWDAAAAFTPTGTATGTAEVDFTNATLSGETNKTITVVDDKTDPTNPVELGTADYVNGPFQFTYQVQKTGTPGQCVDYTNTATIDQTDQSDTQTVTVCAGADLTMLKTATGTYDRDYAWTIDKNADQTQVNIADGGEHTFGYTVDVAQTGITDSGWQVSGTIRVLNPNTWQDVTLTSLSDTIDNGGTCTLEPGPYTVPAGTFIDVDYTCTYATAPTSYTATNTATTTWDAATYLTPTGTATDQADLTLTQDGASNQTIHVTDTYAGNLGTVTATDTTPFTTATFTYDRTEPGVAGTCTSYDNTATITETGQSASEKVALCVGSDLTVSKTASGTFDRTYLWEITKDVDQTQVNIAAGGSYMFSYSVDVAQKGFTDSGWQVAGTITVTNPNDWQDITADVTDAIDNGGVCTVAGGTSVSVPRSMQVLLHYECTYDSAPSSSAMNTATAAWDAEEFFTPNGSASGQAGLTLTQDGTTNQTIHVTDSYAGDLGTVTASDDPDNPAAASFTYTRTESGAKGTCTDYDNTATIVETGQSASKTVTVCVGSDLSVSKTASTSLSRLYQWTIDKTVDQTRIDVAGDGTATFTYGVSVTPTGYVDSAWVVTGKITVFNPNDWQDVTVDVTDALPGGTCTVTGGTQVQVPAGDSVTLDYQCQATSGATVTNTATATWDSTTFATPHGTATGTAQVDFSDASASVTPTNETITVIDDKTDPANPVTLGTADYVNGPFEFTYQLQKTGTPGTCVDYTNTATIDQTGQSDAQTVTVCAGADLSVLKSASGTYDRTYLWTIDKDADQTQVNIADGGTATFHYTVDVTQTGITDSGWQVSGTIRVINPNDWQDITLTNLADELSIGGTCTLDTAGPYLVPKKVDGVNGTLDIDYTCLFTQAPSSYTGTNTATATWDAETYLTPTDTATGTAELKPLTQAGATNKTIHVTDTYAGNLGTVTATDTTPFTTATFTYDRTEPGLAGTCKEYDNTATLAETGQTASQTVTVCVGKDLTVTKTATGTYDRDYLWNITKSVTPSSAWVVQGSTPATFNYTVVVNQTGFTDSGWAASGTITVTNPNDWQDITLTGLADEIDNGGTCAVDPGPYVVPRNGSIEVAYTCSYATTPTSYASTNTATATWDKDAAFTPTGTASGQAGFTLTQAGSTNKTVTVTDTFSGATTTLGTVTATDSAPFATRTFTYKRTIAGVPGQCTTYPNVATITETGQSATQSVTVCTSNNTGALTIGYWRNKNGQSIITGGASTNGVCNSGTWLRQFAPFQDLSATAKCTTVGTYATNVLKAAEASGASMNAMLKGQMLATALNVYFSDPTLGGNKINAPAPIGSLKVDLTKICTDLTCTAFEDSSSVFGGSPKTVLEMLTYAASKANAGGTTWYGNVKATQELAKDAFDALNNRKVLIVP